MKKATILGLVVIFSLLLVATVSAQAAQVDKMQWTLIMWDGNGNEVVIPAVDVHRVVTYDDEGTINITFKGTMPEGIYLPTHAVHFETGHHGFVCTFEAPYFKYTLTPSGKFSEKCSSIPFDD